jgi:hypothetical protein
LFAFESDNLTGATAIHADAHVRRLQRREAVNRQLRLPMGLGSDAAGSCGCPRIVESRHQTHFAPPAAVLPACRWLDQALQQIVPWRDTWKTST